MGIHRIEHSYQPLSLLRKVSLRIVYPRFYYLHSCILRRRHFLLYSTGDQGIFATHPPVFSECQNHLTELHTGNNCIHSSLSFYHQVWSYPLSPSLKKRQLSFSSLPRRFSRVYSIPYSPSILLWYLPYPSFCLIMDSHSAIIPLPLRDVTASKTHL